MNVGALLKALAELDPELTVCFPGGEWDYTEAADVDGPLDLEWRNAGDDEDAEPTNRRVVVIQ